MVSGDPVVAGGSPAEPLLQRSAERMSVFAKENLSVGLKFVDSPRDVSCFCGLHPGGNGHEPDCRSFAASLGAGLRQRCPEGLHVVARLVPRVGAAGPMLLASQGFLIENEQEPSAAAPGRARGVTLPRLSAERVRWLEQYVGLGAEILEGIARLDAAPDPSDELWRDLLGEPTLVGVSPAMLALRESLPTLANSREPLFIDAEPGTGRRLLAASIHRLGPRAAGPLVIENVAALPEELQEAELFGAPDAPGLLAQAAGGTLYLAGVDRLTSACQERLLAALGGGGRGRGRSGSSPDVRVITAAHAGPGDVARRGRVFRDLMALLQKLSVALPPLRERPEDIPLVAERLVRRRAAAAGTTPPRLDPEALEALSRHSWPDNIRGLDEELARAGAGRESIAAENLSDTVLRSSRGTISGGRPDLRQAVGELEAGLIARTLAETNWNKSRAARVLGLSRLGLQKKIDRYAIDRRR